MNYLSKGTCLSMENARFEPGFFSVSMPLFSGIDTGFLLAPF